MIFVDNMNLRASVGNGGRTLTSRWCHLLTDGDDAELVEFAKGIGLRPAWLQHAGTDRSHFDVTEARRRAAVAAGAVEISWRQLGDLRQARRNGLRYEP